LTSRWQAAGVRGDAVLTPIPRGHEIYSRDPGLRLRLFTVFVILILAIACLNVATLLAARVHERQKELAIRSALGAGRVRLLRQLFAEHVLLAAAGGAAGGVLGVRLARALTPVMADSLAPTDINVRADLNVILFTVGVSAVIAIAVGFMPAIRWSRVNMLEALQRSNAGMSQMLRTTGVWWLVPWQVALGTVLLSSAGALAKTVHQLKQGIEASAPDRVWFANVQTDRVPNVPGAFDDFLRRLRGHLDAMPGAEAVGIVTGRPLASIRRGPLRVEGMTVVPKSRPMPWGPPPPPPPSRQGDRPPGPMWIVSNNYVTPGFFRSLALPIAAGRDFNDGDGALAPRVAIVNETLAARAWGKANPIGRRVSWAASPAFDIEIVGVVHDLRSEHLREAAPDAIFFPLAQLPVGDRAERTATGAMESIDLTLTLRVASGRTFDRGLLVRHMAALDQDLFVEKVLTFDEEAGRTLRQERLLAVTGSVLGAIALALLVVGLHGTLAAAVARGQRELGVRLALGASPRSVRSMVIGRGLAVASAGLIIGLPLSYLAARSFTHLLYGVRPFEPLVVAGIAAVVLSVAALSAYLPARRAARVDPLVALRSE
jgi:predicted permease